MLIVGGGINGAGTFRDLAMQGVDCLIVDQGDWCAGTSAAPSRLIHGGLKYLETGEFRLVAESTRERNLLLRNAPHFVKALPTVVPIHSIFGGIVPSARRFLGLKAKLAERGVLVVELGLVLYDWLGRRHRVMPRHAVALRPVTRRRFQAIASTVLATSTYYDARVSQAERLCFELMADGQAANPDARALNHMAVTGATGGRVNADRPGHRRHGDGRAADRRQRGGPLDRPGEPGRRSESRLYRRHQGLAPGRRQSGSGAATRWPH